MRSTTVQNRKMMLSTAVAVILIGTATCMHQTTFSSMGGDIEAIARMAGREKLEGAQGDEVKRSAKNGKRIYDFFDESLLQDDTRNVGPTPAPPRLRPDSDPSFEEWSHHYRNDSDAEVIRPSDPIFHDMHTNRSDHAATYTSRSPVWAIVTEPIKGTIKDSNEEWTEYIPTSHVHFLEQTGAKVIPVSYAIEKEKLYTLLDQVSGVYYTGDSHEAPMNARYQATFANILAYAIKKNHDEHDYFPVFLLGNTLQTFVYDRVPNDKSILSTIPGSFVNANVKLRTTIDPARSFILDELSNQTLQEYVHGGSFFNRQRFGLKVKHFEDEAIINKRYQIVATINAEPDRKPSQTNGSLSTSEKDEFVAILESLDIPLYFILYDVSYSQFVFSERYFSESGKQLVDHSIASRTHAQFIAAQLHDEAAHCKHSFQDSRTLEPLLISKRGKVADINYATLEEDPSSSNMPAGLESQEVYIFSYLDE